MTRRNSLATMLITALTLTLGGCASLGLDIGMFQSWDDSYGGVDKRYDRRLMEQRAAMSAKFQTLSFSDEVTGRSMAYNLFVPDQYDPQQAYPLVLFMADALGQNWTLTL